VHQVKWLQGDISFWRAALTLHSPLSHLRAARCTAPPPAWRAALRRRRRRRPLAHRSSGALEASEENGSNCPPPSSARLPHPPPPPPATCGRAGRWAGAGRRARSAAPRQRPPWGEGSRCCPCRPLRAPAAPRRATWTAPIAALPRPQRLRLRPARPPARGCVQGAPGGARGGELTRLDAGAHELASLDAQPREEARQLVHVKCSMALDHPLPQHCPQPGVTPLRVHALALLHPACAVPAAAPREQRARRALLDELHARRRQRCRRARVRHGAAAARGGRGGGRRGGGAAGRRGRAHRPPAQPCGLRGWPWRPRAPKGTRRVRLVQRDGRDVSTLYGSGGGGASRSTQRHHTR